AGLAPLDSAAIAIGSVVLDANRKTIQHLEGGVIASLPVREGQQVITGEALLTLNSTAARAKQDLLAKQLFLALAAEARLSAERDGLPAFTFPEAVMQGNTGPDMQKILDSQMRLFQTRQSAIARQKEILQQRILQFHQQQRGFEAQKVATGTQLKLAE